MKAKLKPLFLLMLIATSGGVFAQKEAYKVTLQSLCDVLLTTQINEPADPNFGAFICPSSNPDLHPIHSRAAEAMYPFAVAYKLTHKVQYRDAAIKAGNWLVKIQDTLGKRRGGWSENWPDPKQRGWYGTTTDQLISMAGAYSIVKPWLNETEIAQWNRTMSLAADYILATFPIGNVNYNPTGAATLVFTHRVVNHPKKSWLLKADSLMNKNTLDSITNTNLLTGEGNGVDGGYNMAQSIGYIALYGILKNDSRIKQIAANLLKVQEPFVYPNGSIDNSWGTRSFKWNYESGTKTAPGVYFSFALLADMNPEFKAAELKCLNYLNTQSMEEGWIGYGPHGSNHSSSSAPCNYSTFARAQSIALAIEYGAKTEKKTPFSAQKKNWYQFFPDLKVAVIRTGKMMATVSAYGAISRYSRASVSRGGSITNLWYDGFGKSGFLQSSSSSAYERIEAMHMPIEKDLLPLTPRIEFTKDTTTYSNLFEASGTMNVAKEPDHIKVVTAGLMQTVKGLKSDVNYSLTNRFYDAHLVKEITVSGGNQQYRIVEPIVKDQGTTFHLKNDSTVVIKTTVSDEEWELKVVGSTVPFKISLGLNEDKYWSPFPGVDAYPIVISFNTVSNEPQTLKIFLGKKSGHQ